ncbi:MAG: F-box/LRR-repeat protein 3 [Chlamydiales bacterium]|jgi:hypothetical protein|nr:F-box/LRR-repeat protein 3 [Chlamydiales bacterium]
MDRAGPAHAFLPLESLLDCRLKKEKMPLHVEDEQIRQLGLAVFQELLLREGRPLSIQREKVPFSELSLQNASLEQLHPLLIKQGKWLKTLRLSFLSLFDEEVPRALDLIAKLCPNLQRLEFNSRHPLNEMGIQAFLALPKKLEALKMRFNSLSSEQLIHFFQSHPRLKELDIAEMPAFDDETFFQLMSACPYLQFLKVRDCQHLYGHVHLKSTALTHLSLERLNLSEHGLRQILSASPNLKEFEVGHMAAFNDASLCTLMTKCPQLTLLKAVNCLHLIGRDHLHIREQKGKALTHLSLPGCHNISDWGLTQVIQDCIELKHLDITGCTSLTDWILESVRMTSPHIERLKLRQSSLTKRGIEKLAQFDNIRQLALNGCFEALDEALMPLFQKRLIESMNLANTRIGDLSLKKLAKNPLSQLNLARTPISDQGLSFLKKNSYLSQLNLSETAITDAGLRELPLNQLTYLNLSGCRRLTRKGALSIAERSHQLQYLILTHVSLGLEEISQLAKQCSQLVHLAFFSGQFLDAKEIRALRQR